MKSEKATYPALFGLEGSRQKATQLLQSAYDAVESFGPAGENLKSIARYLIEREN
jgi:geranylgeranyl diphosphate synthase type II